MSCPAICSTSSHSNHGSSLMNGLLTSPRSTQQANGSWRLMPSLGPAHHSLPAVGRGLSLGAQGMHDLGWNGGQSWQSRMRAPLSLVYCVFIQKSRWEPSRELDRQSIAIKLCAFLHISSAHPSEVPLRKDKWEGGWPEWASLRANNIESTIDSLLNNPIINVYDILLFLFFSLYTNTPLWKFYKI